jgi:multiple sugar transport system permease protein
MTVDVRPGAEVPTDTRGTGPGRPAPGRRRRRPVWVYLVLGVGLLVMLAPFLWMLLGSLKPEAELQRVPPTWWPEAPSLGNYRLLFDLLDFPRFFTNSTVVAVAVTAGNLVFCSMVGYALAKLDFAGKRLLFALVLGMLMVPGVVTFVPLFVLVSNLGLVNTYPGLILPYLVTPLGVFLMRQFISGLPDELLEAARIDGAGEWRIFSRVILPLCGPALATSASSPSWRPGTTSCGRWWWPSPRTSTPFRSPWPCTRSARTPPGTACCWPARWSSSSR